MRFKIHFICFISVLTINGLSSGCASNSSASSKSASSQYSPKPNDGIPLVFKGITLTHPEVSAEKSGRRTGAMIGNVAGQVAGTLIQAAGVVPGGAIVGIVASTVIGAASTAAGEAIGGAAKRKTPLQNNAQDVVTVEVCRPIQSLNNSQEYAVTNTSTVSSKNCISHYLSLKNNSALMQLKEGDKVLYISGTDAKPALQKID